MTKCLSDLGPYAYVYYPMSFSIPLNEQSPEYEKGEVYERRYRERHECECSRDRD